MKYILLLTFCLFTLMVTAQPPVGSIAPEISLPNAKGEIIHLSSLKGKLVIIDFWASWCRPCRLANKNMVSLYAKYKEKGLEVLGISIDENERAWEKAIAQDKITWLQVIDKKASRGNELLQTWGVKWIPATYLIDRDGKIVAVDISESKMEKLLKQML